MSLANLFKGIAALAQLLPALVAFIKEMEGQGDGATKKTAVTTFLASLLDGAAGFVTELTPELRAAIMKIAGSVIDAVVAAFNAVGLFKKSTPSS